MSVNGLKEGESEMDELIEFGNWLRRKRKEKRITLSQLGSLSGLSKSYLSQLENGKLENVTYRSLKSIAIGLDLPVGTLSGMVGGDNYFGEWLKEQREERNATVTSLSKKIGISRPYLHQLEIGRNKPSIEVLEKIAKGLELPLTDVLDEFGYETIPDNEEIKRLRNENESLKHQINELKELANKMVNLLSN